MIPRIFDMRRFILPFVTMLAITCIPVRAAVIYSRLQDIGIPTNFVGVYLDLDTGTTGMNDDSSPAGWDINPFFGGQGVANSPAFQPARSGVGNADRLLRLGVGATVDSGRLFSTGYGGSDTHLGTQFLAGQEGYLGFRFTTNGNAGPYYGWMRVVFTGNIAGAVIKDWAYENGGTATVTGRVLQGAASGGAQLVTLSPGSGESISLGSALTNTGGNINSVLKVGLGTVTLVANNTYTGQTATDGGVLSISASTNLGDGSATNIVASNGGTLRSTGANVDLGAARGVQLGTAGGTIEVTATNATLNTEAGRTDLASALGTGTSTLDANAETNISVSQTLAALNMGDGGIVTIGDPLPSALSPVGENVSAPSSSAPRLPELDDDGFAQAGIGDQPVAGSLQGIPEPATVTLLCGGLLLLFGFRRRGVNAICRQADAG